VVEETMDFIFGQDGRQAFWLFGAYSIDRPQVLVEHLAVKEKEGA